MPIEMTAFTAPNLDDIRAAAARIAPHACVTPVMRNAMLDKYAGANLFFKCEHLQVGGAFKFRGACNAVWSLSDEEAQRGVVTHSSGNHGTALALAASTRGIPAHIVVPEGAVAAKLANIERAGGIVHRCAATLAAREATCTRVQHETGASLVHPYADARVMAGQGTIALETLRQVPDLDAVFVPLGGGGLAAGCAIALAVLAPQAHLIGAEPTGADDAYQSLLRGERITDIQPHTICDGLRATIGAPNLELLSAHRIEVITVDDDATLKAMRLVWTELKQTVEPSSAIALAAFFKAGKRYAGKRVALVLTGGNVDLDALPFAR